MRRAACLVLFLAAVPAWCGTIHITRAGGPIRIDGDLSDPGWKNATRVDQWWETNPGDNVTPKAKSIAYLAYDDHFFYAGFEFDDPDPSKILGPYNDRDQIGRAHV